MGSSQTQACEEQKACTKILRCRRPWLGLVLYLTFCVSFSFSLFAPVCGLFKLDFDTDQEVKPESSTLVPTATTEAQFSTGMGPGSVTMNRKALVNSERYYFVVLGATALSMESLVWNYFCKHATIMLCRINYLCIGSVHWSVLNDGGGSHLFAEVDILLDSTVARYFHLLFATESAIVSVLVQAASCLQYYKLSKKYFTYASRLGYYSRSASELLVFTRSSRIITKEEC